MALILIELYPGSLLVVSAYGLLDNAVRITGGAYVGSYLDRCVRAHVCVAGETGKRREGGTAKGAKGAEQIHRYLLLVEG